MGNLISPKIKVVRVIILKYVLGYVFLQYNKQGFHRKGNITKLSDVRLESFGSIWKTVTDRGDAVPGSKASSPKLRHKWNYCNILQTLVREYCYRWLTLFTFSWQAK